MMISRTVSRLRGQLAVLANKGRFGIALAALLLVAAAKPADAALMSFNVSFSAHSFVGGNGPTYTGGIPPVDPVSGSFAITFDPTLSYTTSTAGISLQSLNIALGSALSFSYDVVGPLAGRLRVGGAQINSDEISILPSSNDFWLFIDDFTTAPSFVQLGYSQTSFSGDNLFYTLNETGSVTVTPAVSGVPEPASLSLLCLGLAGLAGCRRYRKPSAA